MSYKQQVISPLSGTLEHMFTQYGIDVYHGAGSLVSEHLIEVNEQQLTPIISFLQQDNTKQ